MTSLGDAGAAAGRVVHAVAGGRLHASLTLLVALPAAHVLARVRVPRSPGSCRRWWSCRSSCRPWSSGPRSSRCSARRSPIGLDLRGSAWAILLAHAFFNHAVVVRTVGGLWEGLDPRTEEAARTLGASRWRAFRTVTLPGPPPRHRVGRGHHVPLHLHVLRRGADPRWRRPLDARGRDLPADGRPARPPGGIGARAAPAGRGGRDAGGAGSPRAAARGRGRRAATRRPSPAARPRRAALARPATSSRWPCCSGAPLATLVERSFRTGDGGHGLAAWRALGGRDAGHRAVRDAAGGGGQLAAVRRGRDGAGRRARRPGRGRPRPLPRAGGPRCSTACCCSRSAPRPSPSGSASSSPSTSRSTCGPARCSSRSPRRWWRSRSSSAR